MQPQSTSTVPVSEYQEALIIQMKTSAYLREMGGIDNVIDIASWNVFGERDAPARNPTARSVINVAIELAVHRGESFFVSTNIGALLQDAAETMPDDFCFSAEILPSAIGFALIHRDGFDPVVASWADAQSGVLLSFYENVTDQFHRYLPAVSQLISYRSPVREMSFLRRKSDIPEGMSPDALNEESEAMFRLIRLLGAFFLFLKQDLLATRDGRVQRHVARHAPKQFKPDPVVRVVQLRRIVRNHERPEDQSDIEYSCQWIVRGHWRNQYYPSTDEHRPKWISPYVKGPEDKPLKPSKATIFAVVR